MTAVRSGVLRAQCPRCAEETIVDARRGSLRCGQGHAFEYALFSPASLAGHSRPAALVASAQTPCARHARNAAVAACERCGAFMCALCRVDLDGAPVCLPCFERAQTDQGLGDGGTVRRDYHRLALNVGLLSLLVSPLGPVIGPVALLLWVWGRRQDRRTGEPLHRVQGALGVLLGVLGFALGVIVWMGIFGRTGRGGIRA